MNRGPVKPCILVVDNDDHLLEMVGRRIASSGFEVVKASTGAMAISIFDHRMPDVVVTDLNMPMGDGVELVHHVRARSEVPVIVMTGYRLDFRSRLPLGPGLIVFEKPFDANELVDQIDTAIALRRVPSRAA